MPPSTIVHLDNTVAVLRRSPASVEHHHRHHAVVLTELISGARLDRRPEIVIELNVCRTRRCRTFGTWIGRIVKTYDYINRVVLTLALSVYEGTWTHSPLSLLCITMILRVRRNFFEITMFPNRVDPEGYPRVMWRRVDLEGAREIITRRGRAFLALAASPRDGATGSHLS